MTGARKLMAAAGRHRRLAIPLTAGSALVVMAGVWAITRQPVSTHTHQIRTATTLAERTDFLPASLGPCHWPMRIHGKPARGQVYLTRCYLRALARRDAATIHKLSEFNPQFGFQSQITSRELTDSADARAGVATVTFIQSPVDSAFTTVEITFADGAREGLATVDMSPALGEPAASAGYAWRFQIGSHVRHPK